MRTNVMILLVVSITILAAGSAAAQCTPGPNQICAKLQDVPGGVPPGYTDDAYDVNLMGAYWPDFVWKSDLYVGYWHGGGPSQTDGGSWVWNPVTCTDPLNPNVSRECNDRVFMAWKHFSCTNPSWACASNTWWNIYSGSNNYPGIQWPTPGPVTRMAGWFESKQLPYSPTTCTHNGLNYSAKYTGAGTPAVIYANGTWYMAFDANMMDPAPGAGGLDIHRIAWATSSDGATWTVRGLIVRDASETNCSLGALVSDLYFEGGNFYMLVTSLGTGRIYMLRAPYSATNPAGYTNWYGSTSLLADGRFNFNTLVTPVDRTNFATFVPYVPDAGPNLHATVAKVYADKNTTQLYRYISLVDLSPTIPDIPPSGFGSEDLICADPQLGPYTYSYPLRLYWSTQIDRPMVSTAKYDIVAADNESSRVKVRGFYSWAPEIPWVVPDTTVPRVWDPLTIFVSSCAANNNRNVVRRLRLNLTGGAIFQ